MKTVGGDRFRRAGIGGAILGLMASAVLVAPAGAQVGDMGDYTSEGVHIRTGADTGSTSLGMGYPGDELCLFYYTEGESIDGDPYWWNHTNMSKPVEGFSHRSHLGRYTPQTDCAST